MTLRGDAPASEATPETSTPARPPLVSFIVPAFNAAATLDATLDSIAAQDVADWEAVIVDDGSRDRTGAVARRRAAADRRIRCLRQANGGASAARNTALAQARGKWIAFLDADDWIAPDFLSKLLSLLTGHGDDHVAYCSYVRITPAGEPTPPDWCPELQEDAFAFLGRRCEPAIHCVLVSRRLVLEVGGFDEDLANCEDWDLWMKIARTGARFVGTPEPLAFYRMRAGSLSTLDHHTDRTSRIVQARAFAPDPRVPNPDPRFAHGLDAASAHGRDLAAAVTASGLALARGEAAPARFGWQQELDDPVEARSLIEQVPDWISIVRAYAAARGIPAETITLDNMVALLAPIAAAIEPALPGFGAWMRDRIAAELIGIVPLDRPRRIGRAIGLRIDIRDRLPATIEVGDADLLVAQIVAGGEPLFWIERPILGRVSGADLADAIIAQLPVRDLLRHARLLRRGRTWAAAGFALPLLLGEASRASGGRRAKLRRSRIAVADAIRAGMRAALTGGSGSATPRPGIAIARAAATDLLRQAVPPATPLRRDGDQELDIDADRQAYWEQIFADGDPWDYDNPYEAEKYARTLALLPERPIGSAIELACAEGHFTRRLAGRVETLLAADISERAIARAAQRCADMPHVRFAQLDFFGKPIPGQYDLVVCSEVLYFAEDEDTLAGIVAKLAGAVAPGGLLLTAHAYVVDDDPSRTGFDWGNGVGAAAICRAIAAVPGMALERAIETELYRIALFRKVAGDAPRRLPLIEELPVEAPLDDALERFIVRGGAAVTRVQAQRETCETVPILYFARLVDARCGHLDEAMDFRQFEDTILFLRRNGYRAFSFAELAELRRPRSATSGRPVILAFDDLEDSFAARLLPRMRRSGFAAELLVPAARLLDPAGRDALRALQNEGIGIGYRPEILPADPRAWLEQAARARAALTDLLAVPAPAALMPDQSGRPLSLIEDAGFAFALSPGGGLARLSGSGIAVPTIECSGQESLGMLVELLRSSS